MASTNFKRFNEALNNILSDLEYLNNSTRYNGAQSGIYPASLHNKFAYQASAMATGLADMMVLKGYTVEDGSLGTTGHDHAALVDVLGNLITQYDLDQYDLLYPDSSLADQVVVSSTRSVAEIENRYAGERFLLTFPRGTYVFKNDYATLATTSIQFQAGAKVQPWYSVRSSAYAWANTTGSEYRCDLAAGGDPGIEEPYSVYANGIALTEGTAGALTAGQYAFSAGRLFVRLSDSTDPDTKATGYVTVGYEVTFANFFCPYFSQCFDVAGGGKINLSNCESIAPDWWSDGTSVSPNYDNVYVNAAYESLPVTGGRIYFRGGRDWKFNLTVLKHNIEIFGTPRTVNSGDAWYPVDDTLPVIQVGDSSHAIYAFKMHDFTLHGNPTDGVYTATTSNIGLWVRQGTECHIHDFYIYGFNKKGLMIGDNAATGGADTTGCRFRDFTIWCGHNTDGEPTYGVYGARTPGVSGQTNCTISGFMIWGPLSPNLGAAIYNPSDQSWSDGYTDVSGSAYSVEINVSRADEVPSIARFSAVQLEQASALAVNIKNSFNDYNDSVYLTGNWSANGLYEKYDGTQYNLSDRNGDCLGSMAPRFYDCSVSGNLHFHSGITNDENESATRFIRAEGAIVGELNSVSIADDGSGYSDGDIVEVVQAGAADGLVRIVTTGAGGEVLTTITISQGTGYVLPSTQTISALSQSAGTATATCNGHGYSPGDVVLIAGANQAGYNGCKTILTAGANDFTFAVDSGTVSPATGTITVVMTYAVTGGTGTGFRVNISGVNEGTKIFYMVNTIGDIYLMPLANKSVYTYSTGSTEVLIAKNRGCPIASVNNYGTDSYMPGLRIYRRAAEGSGSAAGIATGIDFFVQDSAVEDEMVGRISLTMSSVTNGAETGAMTFNVRSGGAWKDPFTISGDGSGPAYDGWNEAHLIMGQFHLWFDASQKLRFKVGAPSSDTDGTVIGP